MKPAEILALLPVKPEEMPKIATNKTKPTRESIKYFQEIIQDKAMAITIYDYNLGFLIMVIWESDFYLIKNGNLFVPPTDTGPTTINAVGAYAQITEVFCLYKYDKDKFTTYCAFCIVLISMVTNRYP